MTTKSNVQLLLSTNFNDLVFQEQEHIYKVNNKALPSVSALVKKHSQPFDEMFWADIVAKKQKVKVQEVLDKWEVKRVVAANNGTKVHTYAENWWEDNILEPTCEQEKAIRLFLEWCIKDGQYSLLSTELQMYSKEFWYAGTCDLLLWNNKLECVELFDYKTNEDLDKQFDYLLSPFNYTPSTPFNKYQLQLSYYQIMLEEIGIPVANRYVVWVKPTGTYELRSCHNFTEELKQYLHEN
jgi:hypothetical protein